MEVNRKPVIDTAAEADFGDEGCRCPEEVDEGKHSQDILISGFDGRTPSSAAAAAENLELRETRIAAAVCLYVPFRARPSVGRILDRGVARRSFGLLRLDLLLQIDPSVSDPRACYILRR